MGKAGLGEETGRVCQIRHEAPGAKLIGTPATLLGPSTVNDDATGANVGHDGGSKNE